MFDEEALRHRRRLIANTLGSFSEILGLEACDRKPDQFVRDIGQSRAVGNTSLPYTTKLA